MKNLLPNLTNNGYELLERLGQNLQGGRATYKAINQKNQEFVVIKQFKFLMSEWSDLKTVEREVQVLKDLHHPQIPRYLDSFDSEQGFCLVQEYIDGQSLAVPRTFSSEEIKNIAIQLLSVLVYLQSRNPLVIHRDIKPENLILTPQFKVYLVDFGLARIGGGEVTAMSSAVVGTLGFIPPESLLSRSLDQSADLYSLGVTLICLLSGKKSVEMAALVDDDFRLNFWPFVAPLSNQFRAWLEKMVAPSPKARFASAAVALQEMRQISIHSSNLAVELTSTPQTESSIRRANWVERAGLVLATVLATGGAVAAISTGLLWWQKHYVEQTWLIPHQVQSQPQEPAIGLFAPLENKIVALVPQGQPIISIVFFLFKVSMNSFLIYSVFRSYRAVQRGDELAPIVIPAVLLIIVALGINVLVVLLC